MEGDICERVSRLTAEKIRISCDDKDIDVDNVWSFSMLPNRDDGKWIVVYLGDGTTQYVNLSSGETIVAENRRFFHSRSQISPNGNLILLDSGIEASSARELIVVDMSELRNFNVIYRDEIWEPQLSYKCFFNSESQLVMEYSFDVFEYHDKVVCEDKIIEIKQMLVDEGKYEDVDIIDDRELWKSGVALSTKNATVIREFDKTRVTPSSEEKWLTKKYDDPTFEKRREAFQKQGYNFIDAHNKAVLTPPSQEEIDFNKKYITRYGTFCTVDEMTIVKVIEPENFEKYLEQLN